MASASLAIGQTPVSAPQNVEAGNAPTTETSPKNQLDKISFPQAMKKVKGGADAKNGDSPTAPIILPNIHAPDAVLPPPGMLLPLSLAQGAAVPVQQSDNTATSGDQATAAVANGGLPVLISLDGGTKGGAGNGGRQTAMPVSDEASATLQTAQQPTGNSAAKALFTPIVNEPSQVTAKTDFSALLAPLPSNQPAAQALTHDLAGTTLDKHAGLINISSHMGLDAANGLNGLSQGTDKLIQTPAMPPALSLPLKNPQWGDELSNRVMWMVQHDVQTASIKINPPHLGPLEVQVSMNKDHVDVSFNSHHAAVKEALDASLPKLKEMLGSSGLQLGDANVTHHSFSGQSQYNNQGADYRSPEDGDQNIDASSTDGGEMTSASIYNWDMGSGAVDFYA